MGEGEAEGGTVFCLMGGEKDVVFLFLFFFMCCVLSGCGSFIHHHLQPPLNFFRVSFSFCCLFALYRPSKLEAAYHHTHTLSLYLSDGIQFLLFPLLGSRLDCIKREKKKKTPLSSAAAAM